MIWVNDARFCVIVVISSLGVTEDGVCQWESWMKADHRKGEMVMM